MEAKGTMHYTIIVSLILGKVQGTMTNDTISTFNSTFICEQDLSSCITDTRLSSLSLSEHCLLSPSGEWSEWSVCLRNGVTCGYRWGKQSRTRGSGSSRGTADNQTTPYCPVHTETQRCRMRKRCPTGEKHQSYM